MVAPLSHLNCIDQSLYIIITWIILNQFSPANHASMSIRSFEHALALVHNRRNAWPEGNFVERHTYHNTPGQKLELDASRPSVLLRSHDIPKYQQLATYHTLFSHHDTENATVYCGSIRHFSPLLCTIISYRARTFSPVWKSGELLDVGTIIYLSINPCVFLFPFRFLSLFPLLTPSTYLAYFLDFAWPISNSWTNTSMGQGFFS